MARTPSSFSVRTLCVRFPFLALLAFAMLLTGCKGKPQGPYDLPDEDAWRQIAPGENPFVEVTDEGRLKLFAA